MDSRNKGTLKAETQPTYSSFKPEVATRRYQVAPTVDNLDKGDSVEKGESIEVSQYSLELDKL